MRRTTLYLAACGLLTGCLDNNKNEIKTNNLHLKASVSSIELEECLQSCRFVIVHLRVDNQGLEAACVPSIYGGEGIAAALSFSNAQSGEVAGVNQSYGDNIFAAEDYSKKMQSLIDRPAYVVQSGERLELRVVLESIVAFTSVPEMASLRFSAFTCDQTVDDGLVVQDLRYDLSTQGGKIVLSD
ncbi:hypothetical protein [Brevundimonas sp.]|uniref:hypothetical protein n=1 Tax=Brevundimonas sp. TaxID=1871086 RepID=UPI003D11A5B7